MKKMKLKGSKILVKTFKSRGMDFLRLMTFRKKKELKKFSRKNNKLETMESVSWVCDFFAVNAGLTRFIDDKENFYVGFTSSKKGISKSAVVRNKAKRKLKSLVNENIRKYKKDLIEYDFLFSAKKDILTASFNDLEKSFDWTMRHLIKKIKEKNKKR